MTIEFITQDGTNRQHRIRLQALIGSIEGPLSIASAYVTDSQLLCGVSNRKVRLLTSLDRMNIISGATNLDCLRLLLEHGVHIKCLHNGPRLHAKVYILGNWQAVVSSANLTISGLERNVEVGASFSGDSVRTLITWYEKVWNDADFLDLKTLDLVEQETMTMRREFTKLRKKIEPISEPLVSLNFKAKTGF